MQLFSEDQFPSQKEKEETKVSSFFRCMMSSHPLTAAEKNKPRTYCERKASVCPTAGGAGG
jgi:hypothetical protein